MFADEHIVLGAIADNRTQRKRGLDENERRVYSRSTLFIPEQTLRRPEREFDTRGEEAL